MPVDVVPLIKGSDLHAGNLVPLPAQQFQMMHHFFNNTPEVRACFETLCRYLFSGGLRIWKTGFKPSARSQRVFDTIWVKFCKDVLRELFTYGFVLCTISKPRTILVPNVVSPLEVDIEQRVLPKGGREFKITDISTSFYGLPGAQSKVRRDIVVFASDLPDVRGNLTSKLRSLLQVESFFTLSIACAARAEQQRARPPLVTETSKDTESRADEHIAADGLNLNRQSLLDSNMEGVYQGMQNEMMIDQANSAMASQQNENPPLLIYDPFTGTPRFPVAGVDQGWSHPRVPLPPHERLGRPVMAESPAFLMDLFEQKRTLVGVVTGVPPAFWGSSTGTSFNQFSLNTFYTTLYEHRTALSEVMKEMLQAIHGEENARHAATLIIKHGMTLDPGDNDFQVAFPGLVDQGCITGLFEQGMVDFKTLTSYVGHYLGIPEVEFAKERLDPYTGKTVREMYEEEQRMLKKQQAQGQGGGSSTGATSVVAAASKRRKTGDSSSSTRASSRELHPGSKQDKTLY